jgi:hypothetical protein
MHPACRENDHGRCPIHPAKERRRRNIFACRCSCHIDAKREATTVDIGDEPAAESLINPGLRTSRSRTRIMYIESKADGLTGPARIGRVSFSKSGRSIYYKGLVFKSLKGRGFKANYYETTTGEQYWISGPHKDGRDRLYTGGPPVQIDDDVSEEYWTQIRGREEKRRA